jgi:orotate phosphoribosyltransferase
MNDNEAIFRDAGALLQGHFQLTSGLHSAVYWEKFRVLENPPATEALCRQIAGHFRDQNIELVVGPTTGGVILAFEVARQLSVHGIFAEKDGDKRAFRRGFVIKPGQRILIVDDVLTTGKSVYEVIDAVNEAGGDIVGIGILVNRSDQDREFGYPLFSCLRTVTETFEPDNCPLCAAGIPLVKPGSS